MTLGFLPFGSGHSSVVLEHPLTSLPNWVAEGKAASDSSTATGANFGPAGFSPNGQYMRFGGLLTTLAGTKDAGQVSIEVVKEWACTLSAEAGSSGASLPANQALIELQTASKNNLDIRRSPGPLTSVVPRWGAANLITTNPITGLSHLAYLTTRGKSDYVRLSVGWWTSGADLVMVFAVDGVVYSTATILKSSINEDLGDQLWVGGRSGADIMGDFAVRNLTISTEAPEFVKDRKVLIFGDSQARDPSMSIPTVYDGGQAWEMLRAYHRAGILLDSAQINVVRNPGADISASKPSGSGSLTETIGAALATANPTDVVIIGGTNDAVRPHPADFVSSLQTIQSTVKNYVTVERALMVNVRSLMGDATLDTPTNRARRDVINSEIAAQQFPLLDAYDLHGGETPPDSLTYLGQVTGAFDDIHIGVSAAMREGAAFVAGLNYVGNVGIDEQVERLAASDGPIPNTTSIKVDVFRSGIAPRKVVASFDSAKTDASGRLIFALPPESQVGDTVALSIKLPDGRTVHADTTVKTLVP